jgi:hypothetical protein
MERRVAKMLGFLSAIGPVIVPHENVNVVCLELVVPEHEL